jgi:anti-sigma B factor antagonist
VVSFNAEVITAADCAVLRVTGEIDVYTAPELRQQVIHLVDNGIRHIIGDLRDVDFLDSTGLGVMVGSLKRLRVHQGSLKLVASDGRILDLFKVTGLSQVFELFPSVLDAISGDHHWQDALAGEGPSTGGQSGGKQSGGKQSAEEWCRKHELR